MTPPGIYAARSPAGAAVLDLATGRWKVLDPIAAGLLDLPTGRREREAAIEEATAHWAATGADPDRVRADLTRVAADLDHLRADRTVHSAPPTPPPAVRFAPTARPTARSRAAAGVGLAAALLLLRILPIRHVVAVARAAARLPGRPARVQDAEAVLAAVLAAGAWWPGRVACLEESLAVHLAAALTGHPVRWVLGARFVPHGAHAWVVADGHVIGQDENDRVWPYLPVLTIGSFEQVAERG
ncbi:lasso peptide biosynthesis B2 protein [Streptomyces katsurahamanus]|uniref:Lasso peptide biosynthesis B2 protein n=1 Tax=Streptomyces katsurahamanus TaxID=2577098 RepID=A0ABW9NYW4_9ACTN|nr:lasso peptide biosynthesis B2 protein [Streptomyces katsurahamanus]MQS38413.1 lasso peptide biosynthesis B2 protein [Streptomyces katsurahamanus]